MRKQLLAVGAQLDGIAERREQHRLLDSICDALDQLHELGADDLFWDAIDPGGEDPRRRLVQVRETAAELGDRISGVEQSRETLERGIETELWKIDSLDRELTELQQEELLRLDDFVVEREASELPYRPLVLPWRIPAEDKRRQRTTLLASLLVSLLLGYTVHHWTLPAPELDKPVEIPERLAKLVKKPEPPPPPPKEETKPEPKDAEKTPEPKEATAEPTPEQKQEARKTAESTGVLAFKNSFDDMIENAPEAKLGSEARVSNAGRKSEGGQTQRSIVTKATESGSGGIDTAALSRNVGGAAAEGVTGGAIARVESAIGTESRAGADRPLSDGPGPSRTDEEIQIVFDRYKGTLYRLYNRELRKDPTLQGKLVLRITIEPDGSVSAVSAESTDLASKTLVDQIVARVQRFNFGPKEGVPTVTILYPIDFLPAG